MESELVPCFIGDPARRFGYGSICKVYPYYVDLLHNLAFEIAL